MTNMKIWDYNIPKNWQPDTAAGWIWYLERKINYNDWKGLQPKIIKKYLGRLRLDPGKKLLLKAYFNHYVTR